MKERIIEFLQTENKTSSQFAEEIGVQPSSISHIVSGRNNPSLDFVLKMLRKYNTINPDWLLFGKGNMYRNSANNSVDGDNSGQNAGDIHASALLFDQSGDSSDTIVVDSDRLDDSTTQRVELSSSRKSTKIVIFYGDHTFEEYTPT
jgi:transcriptional regulator with XRE-family HTH domain